MEKVWPGGESVLASRGEFPVVGSALICRKRVSYLFLHREGNERD